MQRTSLLAARAMALQNQAFRLDGRARAGLPSKKVWESDATGTSLAPRLWGDGIMHEHCGECARLWAEYSEATKDQIALVGKAQQAELQQDTIALQKLATLKVLVGERRTNARAVISDHEGTHTQQTKTAAS